MRTRADPWHQGRARLLMALVAISALAPAAIVVAPGPVAAECGGGFTPMPLFTDVAKDARRIVIGTVEGEVDAETHQVVPQTGDPGIIAGFRLRVHRVMRGSAPDTMDLRSVRTRSPRRPGDCYQTPIVYVTPGDVIAIAFGGRMPGVRHRVTSAAWLVGEPSDLTPHAQRLSLDHVL